MRLTLPRSIACFAVSALLFTCATSIARAGTASTVDGLYYTGVDGSKNLLSGGSQDSHWLVSTDEGNAYGGTSGTTKAYVVNAGNSSTAGTVNGSGWAANTTAARWITAPGATKTDGTGVNTGYNYLPGNGTTGTNAASYAYTLAFIITGTGSGVVSNQVSITLALAADDNASVYINPTMSNGLVNTATSTLGKTITSAWNGVQNITLQNFDDGTNANNAAFVIGTNYLVIQVANTNSQTGDNNSTSLNASGLMVYQTSSTAAIISTKPTPEVGAWLPVLGALGFFCVRRFRTTKTALAT